MTLSPIHGPGRQLLDAMQSILSTAQWREMYADRGKDKTRIVKTGQVNTGAHMVLSQWNYRLKLQIETQKFGNSKNSRITPTYPGGISAHPCAWMSSIRSDAKCRAYGPNGRDVLGHGEIKCGAREGGPSQDRDVRDFASVKLPAQVGNRNFKKSESGNFSVTRLLRNGRLSSRGP